jgi:hypothetical protein
LGEAHAPDLNRFVVEYGYARQMKADWLPRRFLVTLTAIRGGGAFMRVIGFLSTLVFLLLVGGAASAQEGTGWLGADTLDVTKAEADTLKWDAPHGAKIGVVATGSPAEKAGLKAGDIIDLADGVEGDQLGLREPPRNEGPFSTAAPAHLVRR